MESLRISTIIVSRVSIFPDPEADDADISPRNNLPSYITYLPIRQV